MRHHKYNPDYNFIKSPIEFNKYTERSILQYCLGATMYMPGTRDFASEIITNKYPGLTSFVLCFEDACKLEDVPVAEEKSLRLLDLLQDEIDRGNLKHNDLPLIIFRVRNLDQFNNFTSLLTERHAKLICAFNFPKFNANNGNAYFTHLQNINDKFDEILYGMPILEDHTIAYKETRIPELLAIKSILDCYRKLVLNVRVGGTDFSSCFGMRRGIDYTIYDIMTVRDCLQDILNLFIRNNDYTVSGPVWEYFRASKEMRFKDLPKSGFQESLIRREPIINDAVDGLMREIILDKANGFVGKTIIHPTHLNYVNGLMAVTKEEYDDAKQISNNIEGVVKSESGNKMNEINPHRNWAERILMRAKVYGVIENEKSYLELVM